MKAVVALAAWKARPGVRDGALPAPPGRTGVVGESVADQGVAPAAAVAVLAVEAEDVEAAGAVVPAAGGQVEGGGAGEAALLGVAHRLDGRSVAVAVPRLDLDEGEGGPLHGHDVDLAAVVDQVADQDLVALPREPAGGVVLPHLPPRPGVRLLAEVAGHMPPSREIHSDSRKKIRRTS